MRFIAADIPPATEGASILDVDTPACIVDLDALERNVHLALETVSIGNLKLRPHMKSHKCAEIAMLQQAICGDRMIGVCCQKVVEAEAMAAATLSVEPSAKRQPVQNILVSNQVVSKAKVARLAKLACTPGLTIGVLVDDADNVRDLSAAMQHAAVLAGHGGQATGAGASARLQVYVEVDVGQARCGVATAAEAVDLARLIVSLPHLSFAGIQTYHGNAQHVRSVDERRAIVRDVVDRAAQVRDGIVAVGIPCPVVTGGGTGTFFVDVEVASASTPVFTEVQPGSFIFSDADYARNNSSDDLAVGSVGKAGDGGLSWTSPWTPSLFLLTTVMSVRVPGPSGPGWVVVDSGLKAQTVDSGPPVVACTAQEYCYGKDGTPGSACLPLSVRALDQDGRVAFASTVGHLTVKGVSDEHTTLLPTDTNAALPSRGTALLLMPGHCDPTVNHFDYIVGVRPRDGQAAVVGGVWRLSSRSAGS